MSNNENNDSSDPWKYSRTNEQDNSQSSSQPKHGELYMVNNLTNTEDLIDFTGNLTKNSVSQLYKPDLSRLERNDDKSIEDTKGTFILGISSTTRKEEESSSMFI